MRRPEYLTGSRAGAKWLPSNAPGDVGGELLVAAGSATRVVGLMDEAQMLTATRTAEARVDEIDSILRDAAAWVRSGHGVDRVQARRNRVS
jgi:hypothetical protein